MYGLVLEGGGAKGSYQMGACRALEELGLDIGIVAGTSVGALNGAMVVQGEIGRACDLWYDINPYKVIKMTEEEIAAIDEDTVRSDGFNALIRRVRKIIAEKGLDVEPLIRLVKEVLDERRIRTSGVDFGIVTVDLTSRKAIEIFKEEIPEGKLAEYVIASASFPAFRRAVIDGRVFIDGSFYNSLPVNMVVKKGCTDIIILRTYGMGIKRRIDTRGLNITSIAPSESLGAILDFSAETSRRNLNLGYFDVMRVFRKLKGEKYYILPMKDDRLFFERLASLDEDTVNRLCRLFGLDGYGGRRAVFEILVPRTADLLGLPEEASYEDIILGLLERIALSCGVERFRIYKADEFFEAIAGRYQKQDDGFAKEIPSFLRSRELLTKLVRDRIIGSIACELFGR